jgi:predicted permease
MRSGLVILEVTLAFVLLIGAGLMFRSFTALRSVNLGFDAGPVLTGRVSLPGIRYPNDTVRQAFFREAAERIAGLPGVTAAGWISWLPLSGQGASSGFNVEDRPPAPLGEEPVGDMRAVTPGYFPAMGMALLEGRLLSEQDVAASPAVAVVSASLARRFWPEASAIGHFLLYEWFSVERVEIVGVVADVHHDGPAQAPLLAIYRPLTQFPYEAMALVVRTTGNPVSQAGAIRGAIRDIDPDLPISDLQPMTALVRDAVGSTRLLTTLLALFGTLGGVLAAIGVYGLMTCTIQQRRREFGIRLALGGRADALVRHTVRRGAVLTFAGLAIGAAVAFLATRLMARLLFGVVPTDAVTFGLTFGLLGLVGIVATWLPARRAARVNLVALLREE